IWINGENFLALKEKSFLYGPFVAELPNFALVDTVNKPTTLVDFTVPTDSLESPWGMAQLDFMNDTATVADPPRSILALRQWPKANRGRFTLPEPPDFLGSTFLKQVVIELAPDPRVLASPVSDQDFAPTTEPLWRYLDDVHPSLWRAGK